MVMWCIIILVIMVLDQNIFNFFYTNIIMITTNITFFRHNHVFIFYFFTFKPVMLYWMRIKAKLTHIKYSRASFSFYYRIFCESSTIYICRKRPDNFSSPPPPKKILWKRCSFEFVWNVYEKKKQPLHRIYMYTYMNEYSNLLIYNAVAVIITWVDG